MAYLLSFPRCGNTWVSEMLFFYCREIYNGIGEVEPGLRPEQIQKGTLPKRFNHLAVGDYSWCEFYRHCRKSPCPKERKISIQKNHDLQLFEKPQKPLYYDPNEKYIILIRNPIHSIISWYEYQKKIDPWKPFSRSRAKFWNKFTRKWVLPKHKNALYVHYESLVTDTNAQLERIIKFVGLPLETKHLQFKPFDKIRTLDGSYDTKEIEDITKPLYSKLLAEI